MATYIQGLTDIPVPIEPFQPDFGMVQKALSTLQSRYEQGFASVKNAYNSVLNAPLTNTMLKTQRDAYVKDAEQKLKNLSSVDLSIPQNQVAAEQVFSPFWEDSRILLDASKTKMYKSEIAKGENAQNSPDEKVREQYNDLSMLYLYNGLEELRDADPNSPEFAKLQPRRWVPFHNLEKFLDERAKDDNLLIKWKSPYGPYMIDLTNGQRAQKPFKTWAHNMLGNNFADQFNVMGTVEAEDGVKRLMAQDPKLTKGQAMAKLATNTMAELRQGYIDRTSEIGDSLKKINAKMEPLLNKNLSMDTDQEEILELQSLNRQRKELEEQQSDLKDEYSKFEDKAPQTYADIIRNPTGYFANVNKQRVVNGFATARAGIESMDIELNPALKEQREADYQRATLAYNYDRLALDREIAYSKMVDTDGDGIKDTYVGDSDGSGSGSRGGGGGGRGASKTKKGDGSGETLTTGQYVGAGITDITKTGSAVEVYQQEQANRLQAANENFLSLDGVARVLKTKLNIGDEDAMVFMSEVRRAMEDPEHTTLTSDARFQPIIASLEKESGMKVNSGLSTRNALTAVAGQYLAEKLKGGGKNMSAEDRLMENKYLFGLQALQVYNASENRRQEAIAKTFAGTTAFDRLKKVDENGKAEIVGVDDLAKDLTFTVPKYEFMPTKDGEDNITLTPQELARYYAEGKLSSRWSQTFGDMIVINGKQYVQYNKGPVTHTTHHIIPGVKEGFITHFRDDVLEGLGALNQKYGSSKEFKDLSDRFNKGVIPNLPEFENKTGKFGVRMKYALRSDVDNEFSYRLLNEMENADNRLGIYYDGERSDSTELDDAVLKLLRQGETSMEKFISAVYVNSTGPHGNPMVEFSVIPVKDTDKTEVTDDVGLKELAKKKTIAIELNPRGSGAITRSIRFNSGFYVFGDMLKGQVYKSDAIMEASGFKFSVMPDNDREPSYVNVRMERTVFDDKTGENKPLKAWDSGRIYFADQTPDEIMARIYQFLDTHLKGNEEANTRYEQSAKTNAKLGRDWLK